MRTTLDLPDKLFKKAKLRAVHEGVALKEVVTRALERGLASSAATEGDERKFRAKRLFASLDKARNTKPVGPLNRAKLYDRTVLRGH
jgi:hypothetical protein